MAVKIGMSRSVFNVAGESIPFLAIKKGMYVKIFEPLPEGSLVAEGVATKDAEIIEGTWTITLDIEKA